MNIYVDFDDTITDSLETLLIIANQRYDTNVTKKDIKKWSVDGLFGDHPNQEIASIFGEEKFFNVSDSTTIVKSFCIDWEKGEFICIARNELPEEEEHLQFNVDAHKLISKIENTTDTLFAPDRYIEVSKVEIDNL